LVLERQAERVLQEIDGLAQRVHGDRDVLHALDLHGASSEKNSIIRRLTSAAFSYADQWPAPGMRCTSTAPPTASRISPISRSAGRNGESSPVPHSTRIRHRSFARSPSSVPPPLTLRLLKRARRTPSTWMSTASSVRLAGSLSMFTS